MYNLMPRFMLTSLSNSKQNLEVVEIRQVQRVIYIYFIKDRQQGFSL